MRPSLAVKGDYRRIWKRVRGLDRIVRVHGQVEGSAGPGCTCKQEHHCGAESTRNFVDARVPYRIASDVDRTALPILAGKDKSDHLPRER